MNHRLRSLLYGYGLAVAAPALATILQLWIQPHIGDNVPFVTLFPAVFVTALFARFGPTMLAVILSAVAAAYFFIPPTGSLLPVAARDQASLAIFVAVGLGVALLSERMHRKVAHVQREREQFSVTLSSIGDGVIVTDQHACITFMNSVAEQITGWRGIDAEGKPLEAIFRILNEETRASSENPVAEALREGRTVGLTNHTILVSKDHSERAIDDSASPIREKNGTVIGVVLVFRDVTGQRASQRAAGRLAALVDSSDDAIFGQTFDGIVTEWNAGAERLFGYRAAEMIGQSVFTTIVPADREEELRLVLARVRQGERVEPFETVRYHRDGRKIPVAIRISPIHDPAGEVIGASAIDRDISEQQAAEQRRNARLAVTHILAQELGIDQAISEILAAVASALHWDAGCFWRLDSDQGVLRCQEFWQSPSQDLGQFRAATMRLAFRAGSSMPGGVWESGDSMWIPDVAADPRFLRSREAQEVGLHGGFACPVAVGREFLGVVEWFSQEIQQPDADLLETMATIGGQIGQYIERKSSQKALVESERLYRAIGESIDYGIWICDAQGRNIYTSDSFLNFLGMTEQQCSDQGWIQALHPDDAQATLSAWQECVRTTGTWDREHRCRGADGQYHPILARGVPVKDDEGQVVFWAGINLDIGRLKNVEDALRVADRRKDEFLAMLAHELRNPLAPIRSGLDVLSMDAGNHQEIIELMQEQVEHVVRLVDDLLDVSRIMRGKIELRKETVDLTSLIHRSVKAVRPLLEGHQQELAVSVPERPIWISADPVRMVQVFENLLNNACKYTDAGGRIEVSAESPNGQALIHVRDTGIGIEPELLPQVFELFTQSTRSLDRAQGGLGIGLTLVQRLVEMHGGSVAASSPGPGQGSTFSVRLPVAETAATPREKIEPHRGVRARRILVVDDNVGAARMLAMLLMKLGDHEVVLAHDGPSALAEVEQTHPEIILLDIGLPGMDGYQVGRTIRETPAHDGILLIALTGYGQEEDRRKSEQAGFDAHLVKPPSVDQISEILVHPKLAP